MGTTKTAAYGIRGEGNRGGFREGAHNGDEEQLSVLGDGSTLPESTGMIVRAEEEEEDGGEDDELQPPSSDPEVESMKMTPAELLDRVGLREMGCGHGIDGGSTLMALGYAGERATAGGRKKWRLGFDLGREGGLRVALVVIGEAGDGRHTRHGWRMGATIPWSRCSKLKERGGGLGRSFG